jgi:hypothetical protein
MENYAGACESRLKDVTALLGCVPPRSVAAAHLGGIAIECRIKALILDYHKIANWGDQSRRPKDAMRNQSIARPGHSLIAALRQMDDLRRKAMADKYFIEHLDRLTHPAGSTALDFIDLRYRADELGKETLHNWHRSLKYVQGWLEKNEGLAI